MEKINFISFVAQAHKATTKESATRLQTSITLVVALVCMLIVIIAYVVMPDKYGAFTNDILIALGGIIAVALTGKVVGSYNEHKYPMYNNPQDDNYENPKS